MDFTLNNLAKTSTNWLFPKKCIVCKQPPQENHPCCQHCYDELPFQSLACHQCGQRFAADSDYCGRCIDHPPAFDACFCPFQYKKVIKTHIQSFKYYEKPELAHNLAQLLKYELQANDIEYPELIIPVPLHINKLRHRGFNQSQLLANALGTSLDIEVAHNIIKKHKATEAQAGLTLKQRSKNLKKCFSVNKKINAKSVVIIDDVITTGTTVNEISKILKRNGVNYIQIWGIAHTT